MQQLWELQSHMRWKTIMLKSPHDLRETSNNTDFGIALYQLTMPLRVIVFVLWTITYFGPYFQRPIFQQTVQYITTTTSQLKTFMKFLLHTTMMMSYFPANFLIWHSLERATCTFAFDNVNAYNIKQRHFYLFACMYNVIVYHESEYFKM